jgi:acyl-CoA thioesterase YciA
MNGKEQPLEEPWTALQVVMMPRDANPIPTLHPDVPQNRLYATIFGGVLLSHIDMAGAIAARRTVLREGGNSNLVLVTVAMHRVEFKMPVLVGDVVRFQTRTLRVGRTSITMRVEVFVEKAAESRLVTEAEVVYVGIDMQGENRLPTPLGIASRG